MDALGRSFRLGGVVVALVGFGITRVFVGEALRTNALASFLIAELLPLIAGLGVTVYGVALAVGAFPREYVLTVTRWCLIGLAGMALILLATSFDRLVLDADFRLFSESPLLVANVLLGGTVGGALVGHHSATNRRQQRQLKRQANRALLLDRFLRHEVINAVNIIVGHTDLLDGDDAAEVGAVEAIDGASRRIAETIEDVGELLERRDAGSVDVGAVAAAAVESVRPAHDDVAVEFDEPTGDVDAVADDRLDLVVQELLENACEDGATDRVEVDLAASNHEVRLSVRDDGSGLPGRHRELLSSGEFPEYDDPSAGFGLQIVRLLVLQYGGRIAISDGIDGEGTTVIVTLPRVDAEGSLVRSINVPLSDLFRAGVAGVAAAVAMGAFFSLAMDFFPIIGVLYGVANPVVGWVTHLFHSVVFSLVFAAAYSHPSLDGYRSGPLFGGLAGIAWGTVLWLVAAGVIMPLWLRFVGVPTQVPNVTGLGFVSHAIWGSTLGVAYELLRR